MTKQPLYVLLANLVQARLNCEQSNNIEWFGKHSDNIETLMQNMPTGCGFDSGTKLDYEQSTGQKLVFTTSFHQMDEMGGYCGWSEHTLTVTPTFGSFDIDVESDYSDVSNEDLDSEFHDDYIREEFSNCLEIEIDRNSI